MSIKKTAFRAALIALFLAGGVAGIAAAQAPPAIRLNLTMAKQHFLATDNIPATLVLQNIGADDIYTSDGFNGKLFYLYLVFTKPDGKLVTSDLLHEEDRGKDKPHVGPVRIFLTDTDGDGKDEAVPVEVIEVLPAGTSPWGKIVEIPDAKSSYYYFIPPVGAGKYSVKAVIPMRTYPGQDYFDPDLQMPLAKIDSSGWEGVLESNTVDFYVIEDKDRDGYYFPVDPFHPPLTPFEAADCDDSNGTANPGNIGDPCKDCNPDTLCQTPKGTIKVLAELHTVQTGTNPGSQKSPVAGIPVRVYKTNDTCVSGLGFSWQKYPDIYARCTPATTGITDSAGQAMIPVDPGDYILIGLYDPDKRANTGDEVYIGRSVGLVAAFQTVEKYLQVIKTANGKNTPAKYRVIPGSELMIIEPEYIEWTSTQELYPFIYQSRGDWSVSVSITPPEGFVTNYSSLDTRVNDTVKVVQFTVTDVGSQWVDTKVRHRIKHKGKKLVVKSTVGVKKKAKPRK